MRNLGIQPLDIVLKLTPDPSRTRGSLHCVQPQYLALAHTEMGEPEPAYAAHEEVIKLRLKVNIDRIGNSYMASLLLRLGSADEAEEMLARCPALRYFTDESFLKTGNPRLSGDMVLLSRIRRAQGRLIEALRLASKALTFRRTLLGNRLKRRDSLYDVA